MSNQDFVQQHKKHLSELISDCSRSFKTPKQPINFLNNPLNSGFLTKTQKHSCLRALKTTTTSILPQSKRSFVLLFCNFLVWVKTTDNITFLFFLSILRLSVRSLSALGSSRQNVKTTPRYTVFTSHANIQELEKHFK